MKTCPGCGNPFTPENPRQRYCNETCRNTYNMRLKRQRKQARKAEIETMAARETFGGKSHLSITEAARFLGVSRPTLYARINAGELTPLKVSSRTVRIPIEQLTADSHIQPQPIKGDWSVLISKAEVLQKYNISESWLMRRMKEEGFRPRIIKGKAFYPKKEVDRMFKPKPLYNKEDWYNAEDLMQSEGITRKYISAYVREKKIPVQRDGRLLLISKKEWDRSRLFQGDIEKNYLTVDQAKKYYHMGQQTFYDKVKAAALRAHALVFSSITRKPTSTASSKTKPRKSPLRYARTICAVASTQILSPRPETLQRRNAGRRRNQSSDGRQLRLVQERRIGQTLQKDKRQWE